MFRRASVAAIAISLAVAVPASAASFDTFEHFEREAQKTGSKSGIEKPELPPFQAEPSAALCRSALGGLALRAWCRRSETPTSADFLAVCVAPNGALSLRADACTKYESALDLLHAEESGSLCADRESRPYFRKACQPDEVRFSAEDVTLCAGLSEELRLRAFACAERERPTDIRELLRAATTEGSHGVAVSGLFRASRGFPLSQHTPRAVVEHPQGRVLEGILRQGIGPTGQIVRPRSMIRLWVPMDTGLVARHWYWRFPPQGGRVGILGPLLGWNPGWTTLGSASFTRVPPTRWSSAWAMVTGEDANGLAHTQAFVGYPSPGGTPTMRLVDASYELQGGFGNPQHSTEERPMNVGVGTRKEFTPGTAVRRLVDDKVSTRVFGVVSQVRGYRTEPLLVEERRHDGAWQRTEHGFPTYSPGDHERPAEMIIGAQSGAWLNRDHLMMFAHVNFPFHQGDEEPRHKIYFRSIQDGRAARWLDLGAPPSIPPPAISGGAFGGDEPGHRTDNEIIGAPLVVAYMHPVDRLPYLSVFITARYGSEYELWERTFEGTRWNRGGWRRHGKVRVTGRVERLTQFELTSGVVWYAPDGTLRINLFGHSDSYRDVNTGVHHPASVIGFRGTWNGARGRMDWQWDDSEPAPDGANFFTHSSVVVNYTDMSYMAVFGRTSSNRVFERWTVFGDDGNNRWGWQWRDLELPEPEDFE